MAVSNISPTYISYYTFSEHEISEKKLISSESENITECSEKQQKEEINQSLLESDKSEKSEISSKLGMSSNVASKLCELTLPSDPECLITKEASNDNANVTTIPRKPPSLKATPKQIFPNISCLPLENNIIYCFIVSVWDNIVGPQTVYVWKRKSNFKSFLLDKSYNKGKDNSYKLVNSSIKGNENIRNKNSDLQKNFEFEDIPDKEKVTIVRSKTVGGKDSLCDLDKETNQNDESPNEPSLKSKRLSLSNVVKYVTEHTVGVGETGQWSPNKMSSNLLTASHQDIVILTIRFYIIEDGAVPYSLSAVVPFQDEPSFIPVFNLAKEMLLKSAAKCRLFITKEGLQGGDAIRPDLLQLCTTLSSLSQAGLTHYPVHLIGRPPDDRKFAEKVLTSHWQTMASTVVVADSPNEANRLVMWLGQFLCEEDLSISRIALSEKMWPFQPGLAVQAVVRDSSGSVDLPSSAMLSSRHPLTLVDVSASSARGVVRQMASAHVHARNCEAAARMELLALWHDLEHMPAPSQSLFESVESSAPLVRRFLHDWDLLSGNPGAKIKFLKSFYAALKQQARAFIAWGRCERLGKRIKKENKLVLQSLRSTFSMEEADVKIILAQAELLQPGFDTFLFEK